LTVQSATRLTRDALIIMGVVAAVAVWCFYTFTDLSRSVDARYYWAADPANLYPHPDLAEGNGYNYSPAFELVAAWGRLLPFDVFVAIWRGVLLGALVYLAGPLTIFVLFLSPVTSEVNAGNIQILLALAIVLGFRWPGTWAFVLLTKVSPGVGLLWFVVRREWRHLAIALGTTAIVAIIALALWWEQWPGYFTLITSGKAPSVAPFYLSLYQRLPFAVGIVLIGAWRGWRWTVPAAATLALPVFYFTSLAMLVGVLPYVREWLGRKVRERGWWSDATPGGARPARRGPGAA
jgi:hypothetical protein